jgi:two-component system chemotaxis response regulator CheB
MANEKHNNTGAAGSTGAVNCRAKMNWRSPFHLSSEEVFSTMLGLNLTVGEVYVAKQSIHAGSSIRAIGASTGGTEAIREVLVRMPENSPGIGIVQHIPPVFSATFANRLNDLCRIRMREASDGDRVMPGLALVAPGNFHMALQKRGGLLQRPISGWRTRLLSETFVDVLFDSVVTTVGADAIGAIRTGMGADGAKGMLKMKRAGARTIAQCEASCVVFGMPQEAIQLGAVDHVLPLSRVAGQLMELSSLVHA